VKKIKSIKIIPVTIALLAIAALIIFGQSNSSAEPKQLAQLWSKSSAGKKCPPASEAKREFDYAPYYTGPLVDAHVHMPVSSSIVAAVAKRLGSIEFNMSLFNDTLTRDALICNFESEGVQKLFGFFLTTRFSFGAELGTIKKLQKEYPGRVVASLMPAPFEFLRVSPDEIRKALDKNKGLIKGIGELKIFDGTSLDNPHYSELYKIADEYNLVVMMHPHFDDLEMVKRILKQYPEVDFLFHGGEKKSSARGGTGQDEFIDEIMAEFGNVYYSIGTAPIHGFKPEHLNRLPEKNELWEHLRESFDKNLRTNLGQWKYVIEKYPDRFMWETDRQRPQWIFDKDFGHFLEESARTFIGQLAPSVREKFAYKNAEKLFDR
jgi:predicted TIM-barrel fold metal-dependent hydrolase